MAGARHTTSLRTYALTRLALALPMIWILLTMVFVLLRVAPGDPISAALGGRLSPEQLQERRHAAGYDEPLIKQYFEYLGNVVTLDFGETIVDNRPVTEVIRQNGAATLELTIAAFLVSIAVGIPIGLICGRYRDTPIDVVGRFFGIVIYAAPVFFLGFLAQIIFSQWLGWLPSSGRASPVTSFELSTTTNLFLIDSLLSLNFAAFKDVLEHLILPATTLGLVIGGVFIRLVRVNVLQTLQGDYIEAARARGLSERNVVWHHAFKNALVPVITVIGLQVALLLGGAVLTEQTFNWPGIGSELVRYLNNRDYIAIQGIITFFALLVVFISLLIDLVNAWVDPRVRY
jgi:peptide/nickel transport system permease protein